MPNEYFCYIMMRWW